MGTIALVLGLSLCVAAAGCGSDDAGTGGAGGGGQGGAGGQGADGCDGTADPSVTDVTGRWAYLEVGSQLIQAPAVGDPFHNGIVSLLILEQTQTGSDVAVTGEYCDHYTHDPDAVVHAVIPAAYLSALKPVTRTGTFSGGAYHLAPLAEVVGAALAAPDTEDLPVAPDDPRVIDEDSDGKPGVTIALTGLIDGEVYAVERKKTELDGVAASPDRIEGLLTFSSEQSVLASDPASIKSTTDATQSYPDPEPCNSYFRMVRIPDTADCATVKQDFATLFP
ncbi:MAG: hypothetical protein IT372_01090 [Polyangiaceae bacterium]|nr:hypothetical protein [Polyangiaceae bacterium]